MKRKKKIAGVPAIAAVGVAGIVALVIYRRRKAADAGQTVEPLHWIPTGQPQAIFLDLPAEAPVQAGDTIYNSYSFQTFNGGTPGGRVGGEPHEHDANDAGAYPTPTSPPVVTRPGPVYYDPGGDVWDLPSRLPTNPIPGAPPVAE